MRNNMRKEMPKAKKGTLKRLLGLLLHDYKWMFVLQIIFIVAFAFISTMPAVYIKTIASYIELSP